MTERTVYVTNKSGHDFSPAENFGELRYMTEGWQDPWELNRFYRIFADALVDSRPNDLLLVSGLPIMNMIAGAVFARMHGKLNLLIYSRRDQRYEEFWLNLDNLLQKEEE